MAGAPSTTVGDRAGVVAVAPLSRGIDIPGQMNTG